jgi:hypothetical protein
VRPFLEKFCFDCHSNGAEEGGIALDDYTDAESVVQDRQSWEKILKMVAIEAMPPGDHDPLPSSEVRERVVAWIDAKLHYVDCDLPPDPGRVTIRRLNRAEYNNTVRDLLGVDFQPAADFPSDEVGEGFDNIGDVLSLPPLLFEKYMDAAEEVARRTIVGKPHEQLARALTGGDLGRSGGADVRERGFVWMSSTAGVYADLEFPAEGEYAVRVEVMADQAGDDKAQVEMRLDGKKVDVFTTQRDRKPEEFQLSLSIPEGRHKVEAWFINDYYQPDAKDPGERDRNLGVRTIEVKGPRDFDPHDLPEPHRRLVIATPENGQPFRPAAEKILRAYLPRAFRRPVTDLEVERFAALVEMAKARGETFEQGVQVAVAASLVSPHFLFRVERDIKPDDPQTVHDVGDYELASRLSYFLWSSMPDAELFRLAAEKTLHKEDVLRAQVRRMLADPKSRALVQNFATQWLGLRNLAEVEPDPDKYPQFNDALRADMQTETEMFFAAVIREDRSILEFLTGDFTFVNERLAKLYGMKGVTGDNFRQVSLADTPRRGVLTQASILTLTSNPTRTSPVKRGKWIMENMLGEAPPPPPPDIPELEAITEKAPKNATLREKLELHRADPGCAACHRVMDALGFGFENFDPIGRWRDKDAGGAAIDASAELLGSGHFDGPVELVGLLKERDEEFRRTLVEKMLTYALGRGLDYYDRCAVDEIGKDLQAGGDRFRVLVTEIVLSDPFLRRRGEAAVQTKPEPRTK